MQIVCYENNIQQFEPQTLRLGNTLHYGTSPKDLGKGAEKHRHRRNVTCHHFG